MKKKKLLISLAAASIILAAVNVPVIRSQETAGVEISPTSSLTITGTYESTDGNFNFKNFEVEAKRAGKYYTEFWLLPAKYTDNNYTTFTVYVNGDRVGKITPTAGNWQSARVEGIETLELSEGRNVISIATPAPEIPAVETLKVASNDLDACISSEAYEEYLENAKAEVSYDVPNTENSVIRTSQVNGGKQMIFQNVPLKYTFYNIYNFNKGQDVIITSTSSVRHRIDVLYYGSSPIINPGGPGILYPNDPIPVAHNEIDYESESSNTVINNYKDVLNYIRPNSDEMQGYGWLTHSERSLTSSDYIATAKIKIPKSGRYLVRVGHNNNGGTSIANVNINNTYYYENVPITRSYRQWNIPADYNEYAVMTKCNTPGTDDPYLFIHGADCNRVVGFNDDAPSDKRELYDLSPLDSYISQTYRVVTSGISVCNFSSLKPDSYCDLYVCNPVETTNLVRRTKTKKMAVDTELGKDLPVIDDSVIISGAESLNGTLSVVANEDIKNLSVHLITGNCVYSSNVNESSVEIPVSALNISQSGIYIVTVETANGKVSRKFVVR